MRARSVVFLCFFLFLTIFFFVAMQEIGGSGLFLFLFCISFLFFLSALGQFVKQVGSFFGHFLKIFVKNRGITGHFSFALFLPFLFLSSFFS